MQRDKRVVESALKAKGFRQADNDHHFFIYWTVSGKKTPVRTKTSHGTSTRTIQSPLLSKMAKQCKLRNTEFLDLVDCPMDQGKYEEILTKAGEI